jgi:hypothetical protein
MMKKTQKKTNHGGQRPGAGRPKSDTPTVTLSWRVPASIAQELRIKIDALIIKEKLKVDSDQ